MGELSAAGGVTITPTAPLIGGTAGGSTSPGKVAVDGAAADGGETGDAASGGPPIEGPCSPAALELEGLPATMAVEARLLAPPPSFPISDDPIITDTTSQTLVFGTLLSTSPVQFATEGYSELTSWHSQDCRVRPQGSAQELGWAEQSKPSCLNADVNVDIGASGYFWADSQSCCIYAYRAQLDSSSAVFPARKSLLRHRYFFSGELLEPVEATPDSGRRDPRTRYSVRVKTVYLNLPRVTLTERIETEIITSISHNPGEFFFWGDLVESSPIVLSSIITSTARPAWFCPAWGRYRIQISRLEKGNTGCRGSGSTMVCSTDYMVTGTILETLQGRVADGQTVTFKDYSLPSKVIEGGVFAFVGTDGDFFGFDDY